MQHAVVPQSWRRQQRRRKGNKKPGKTVNLNEIKTTDPCATNTTKSEQLTCLNHTATVIINKMMKDTSKVRNEEIPRACPSWECNDNDKWEFDDEDETKIRDKQAPYTQCFGRGKKLLEIITRRCKKLRSKVFKNKFNLVNKTEKMRYVRECLRAGPGEGCTNLFGGKSGFCSTMGDCTNHEMDSEEYKKCTERQPYVVKVIKAATESPKLLVGDGVSCQGSASQGSATEDGTGEGTADVGAWRASKQGSARLSAFENKAALPVFAVYGLAGVVLVAAAMKVVMVATAKQKHKTETPDVKVDALYEQK